MPSILAPVSDPAYKEGHLDWYGVVELDAETGEEVWRFDATESSMDVCQYYQDGPVVKQTGFRPSSVERMDDGRTLVAGYSRGVIVDEDGDVVRRFTHELFNDVHELQYTDRGTYLAASTGMDTLVLLDEDFEELWRWHMWEHVDPESRPGAYYPDEFFYRDVRDMAWDPDDRYHLNYATYLPDGSILCSALNYGIFTVDPDTDEVTRTYTDLDRCHNPRKVGDWYAVAESGADRVVRVDWDGFSETLFEGGLDHVKDADPTGEGDQWLLADNKNHRVLLWTEGESEPDREYHLGEGSYPYDADYLTGDDSFA